MAFVALNIPGCLVREEKLNTEPDALNSLLDEMVILQMDMILFPSLTWYGVNFYKSWIKDLPWRNTQPVFGTAQSGPSCTQLHLKRECQTGQARTPPFLAIYGAWLRTMICPRADALVTSPGFVLPLSPVFHGKVPGILMLCLCDITLILNKKEKQKKEKKLHSTSVGV